MFMLPRCRTLMLVTALGLATACGRSGTGPSGLTPEQVGGLYHICELVFTPNNVELFPPVDIRARAMDTSPDAEVPARLSVDQEGPLFALTYLRGTFLERHEGQYRTGRQSVEITFANPAAVLSRVLLPGVINFGFQANPRRLEFSRGSHDVGGQDYATLRGISGDGAPPTIRGTVAGRFQVGGCG